MEANRGGFLLGENVMRTICKVVFLFMVYSVLLSPAFAANEVFYVPGDANTIAGGLALAASSDTVIVAAGTYLESDLRLAPGVYLIGAINASGEPATIIDNPTTNQRTMLCTMDGGNKSTLENLVLAGSSYDGLLIGYAAPDVINCSFVENVGDYAWGVYCIDASPHFYNCLFSDNQHTRSTTFGSGVYSVSGDDSQTLTFDDCTFQNNYSSGGAALAVTANDSHWASVYLNNCTFYANELFVDDSACIQILNYANVYVNNSIVASTINGQAFIVSGTSGAFILNCTDAWNNDDGNYSDIEGQFGINGNISADPMFIDPDNGNFDIYVGSPCGPTTDPNGCGQIGSGSEDPTIIYDDGSGEYATIAAAVSAVPDSTYIFLANGTFTGAGNIDVVIDSSVAAALTITSASGNPDSCIIDLQGSAVDPHRAFTIASGVDSTTVLSGFTITGGYVGTAKGTDDGGAILIEDGASPTIENLVIDSCAASGGGGGIHCVANSAAAISNLIITDNAASGGGGGIHCEASSSPTITNVILIGNSSTNGAGAIHCEADSEPDIIACTMVQNASSLGAVYFGDASMATMSSCIVAFTVDGPAVACEPTAVLEITCTDIFANDGGDWSGCIDGLDLVGANFSADPMFCSLIERDLYLKANSPCALEFSPGSCGQIGALGAGCEATVFTVGSSGYYTTLAAALNDAPNGSTFVLDGGVYSGPGFSGLLVEGQSFTIEAAADSDSCVIVCAGTSGSPNRAFSFLASTKDKSQGSAPMVLRGLTIRGGYGTQGGAISSRGVDLHLENCLLYDNEAVEGGAVFLKDCQAIITSSTLIRNTAVTGGGIYCDNAWPEVISSIIYGSTDGEALFALESGIPPVCTDIFGNSGGDWSGALSGMQDINGNLAIDPLFCDVDLGQFGLTESSPCHPDSNACQFLIGATTVGCSSTSPVFGKDIPQVCVLGDNYPNPFNPLTTIRFGLPDNRHVKLVLFDVRGRQIAVLLNEVMAMGWHDVQWKGRDDSGRRVSSGVYFYQLDAGGDLITRSMALIK